MLSPCCTAGSGPGDAPSADPAVAAPSSGRIVPRLHPPPSSRSRVGQPVRPAQTGCRARVAASSRRRGALSLRRLTGQHSVNGPRIHSHAVRVRTTAHASDGLPGPDGAATPLTLTQQRPQPTACRWALSAVPDHRPQPNWICGLTMTRGTTRPSAVMGAVRIAEQPTRPLREWEIPTEYVTTHRAVQSCVGQGGRYCRTVQASVCASLREGAGCRSALITPRIPLRGPVPLAGGTGPNFSGPGCTQPI
jgi:hypothetical protein